MKIRWSIFVYVIKTHIVILAVFITVALIWILLGYEKPTVDRTKFYLWCIAWVGLVIYLIKSKIDLEKEEEYRKELDKND